MSSAAQMLCFTGVLLFLLGLLTGFGIPRFRSSRLGLSAHLTGVQSGTFLLALGLLWPRLALATIWSGVLANGTWVSLYLVWLSLLLAALFVAFEAWPCRSQARRRSHHRCEANRRHRVYGLRLAWRGRHNRDAVGDLALAGLKGRCTRVAAWPRETPQPDGRAPWAR